MLELKAFVQESVHALDDSALLLLSETLRVDLRGCDDRRDIERILTGLLCLDKDTALGTFLTWLRTRESQLQTSGLIARKTGFLNTFVPVISPRKAGETRSNNYSSKEAEVSAIKDHHLNDEISSRLDELKLLEHDFKEAERHVHSGSPSFEKLKVFLVKLTQLRAKEQDVRRFFIQQSRLLTEQHAQMKDETLHTRAQLDFFVDGFTNLRRRHDELVEKSTHMKAENEVAQDIFLSITAQESHFGAVLHRTMLQILDEKYELCNQLESAQEEIRWLQMKQHELKQLVSRLKKERGDALKDSNSYKLQLRNCKRKMDQLAVDGPDCSFFRQQAIQLRGSLSTLLGIFRESIARDTKSAKQTLSKEVLRSVQSVLVTTPSLPDKKSTSRTLRVTGGAAVNGHTSVARVVEKKELTALDVDQVVRGVVLLGGQDNEAESSAKALCSRLRYVPVDLKKLLEQLRDQGVAQKNERISSLAAAAESLQDEPIATPVPSSHLISAPTATVENYLAPLAAAIKALELDRNVNGVVFYNYELTARDANLLIGVGIPIDGVLELSVSTPSSIPLPTPVQPPPATPTKSSSRSRAPTTSSRADAGSRPSVKTSPSSSSPSRQSSHQQSSDAKRGLTSTPSATGRPTTNVSSPTEPPTTAPKLDRKAAFVSMPHAFTQLAPATFADDRVDQILLELLRLKRRRETPFVVWDDSTSQVNEALLMYAEEIHVMLWVEQENRKPKKPGQDVVTKPGTPGSTRGGRPEPTSKTPVKAPSKANATGLISTPNKAAAKPARSSSISPIKAAQAVSPTKALPKKPTTSTPPKRKA